MFIYIYMFMDVFIYIYIMCLYICYVFIYIYKHVFIYIYIYKHTTDYLNLCSQRQLQNQDVRFHSFYISAPDSRELLDSHSSRLYATRITIWISLGELP